MVTFLGRDDGHGMPGQYFSKDLAPSGRLMHVR